MIVQQQNGVELLKPVFKQFLHEPDVCNVNLAVGVFLVLLLCRF